MKKDKLIALGLLTLVVAALSGCMGTKNCIYQERIETYSDSRVELAAMRNQQDVEGHIAGAIFIIGAIGGDIHTEDTYSYYYYLQDGGIMRGKVPTDNAIIYEENRTDGELITHYPVICYCNDCNPLWLPPKYEFHVPKGTVVREFRLT